MKFVLLPLILILLSTPSAKAVEPDELLEDPRAQSAVSLVTLLMVGHQFWKAQRPIHGNLIAELFPDPYS